ncbi:hypothetical protein R1flu_005415 [Riccia fluitans]|uniref:Major facilitator superfamily (MFS) profile domain-containing protein n=1 Tax=Riccia fluitans TaxID=41844 RepID=A0ABD1YTM1_9MARC
MTGVEKASMLLLNLAAVVERANQALLPAASAEIATDFGVGLATLEWTMFAGALVQAMAAPFSAYLSLRHNRFQIIAGGAIFWAIATASVGISTSYWQAAIATCVNGVGVAIAGPAILSLVADLSKNEARGVAFGWLYGVGQMGAILVHVLLTLTGSHTVMGLRSWRATLICIALSSILIGVAFLTLGNDPRAYLAYSPTGENVYPKAIDSGGAEAHVEEFIQGSKLVLKVTTFQILVIQGILGRLPWSATVFLKQWLILVGFDHSAASYMVSFMFIGSACGSLAGGWVGDKAAIWSHNGRIICAQFSMGLVIPLSAVLVLGLREDTEFLWTYGSVIFFLGFFIAWILPATSWPIFAEVVPEELRTTAFAVDLAVEKLVSAFPAPFIAVEATRLFGHREMKAAVEEQVKSDSSTLGKDFFACVSVSSVLSILIMFRLCSIYPKDREQAKNLKALAAEIRALEMVENWNDEEEDKVWDGGWENLGEDDDDVELTSLLNTERERIHDQDIT